MRTMMDGQLGFRIGEFAEARPRLRAVVRARADIENKNLRRPEQMVGGRPSSLVTEDIGIGVCLRVGDEYLSVSDRLLDLWGVTFPAAILLAAANADTGHPKLWGEIQPGLFLTGKKGTPEDTAAALLLDPAKILALPVKGRHVAMVLTRDAVAVTGLDDEEGLLRMALAAQTRYLDEFFVSARLYCIEDGRLAPHHLPPTHPAWVSLQGTAAVCDSFWSASQARALNALSRQAPAIPSLATPIFVGFRHGRCHAVMPKAGDLRLRHLANTDLACVNDCLSPHAGLARSVASGYAATVRRLQDRNCAYIGTFAVWPKDAGPLLLPKADLIAFFDPSTGVVEALVEWGAADGILSPAGMWPPRFLAGRYPDPDEIKELRSVDA